MAPSLIIRAPTCRERPASTGTRNSSQSRAITVVSRKNPVKGLPPWRVWTSSKKTSHPHGLESSELDFGVQKAHAPEPGRALSGRNSRGQGSAAIPNGRPCKSTNTLDDSTRRGGQAALIPEFAEDLAIHKKSAALKRTRPCAELVGCSTHRGKKGLPILLHSFRGAEQVKTQNPDGP